MMSELEHLQHGSWVGGMIELEEMGQLFRGRIGSITQADGNCSIQAEEVGRVILGDADRPNLKPVSYSFCISHSSIRLAEDGQMRVVTPYVGTFRLYPPVGSS